MGLAPVGLDWRGSAVNQARPAGLRGIVARQAAAMRHLPRGPALPRALPGGSAAPLSESKGACPAPLRGPAPRDAASRLPRTG